MKIREYLRLPKPLQYECASIVFHAAPIFSEEEAQSLRESLLAKALAEGEIRAPREEKKARQINISSRETEELFQTRKPRRRTTDPTDLLKLK